MKVRFSNTVAALMASGSLLAPTLAHAALVISNKPTQNVACNSGYCTATAKKAVLNVTDLANLIASSPVTIQSGSKAQDIVFNAPFSWTSANGLTLEAYRSILINKPVADSGPAPLTLTTNDGGSNGELHFAGKGSLSFLSTSNHLIINTLSYVLVDSTASLADAVTNNSSGFYALAHDYDASVDGPYASSPVSTTFEGTFEGLGNRILNLTINALAADSQKIGLFAWVKYGTVADLGLAQANVSVGGAQSQVGGLVGENEYGNIVGSYFSGKVTGSDASLVGGLVGYNGGTLDHCWSEGNVVGGDGAWVGGLAGESDSVVRLSHSAANVSAGNNGLGLGALAGGLVGYSQNIDSSYALGAVSVGDVANGRAEAGGLVGEGAGKETNSYAIGRVTGGKGSFVGGFIGGNEINSYFYTSYSIGAVRGKAGSKIGGSSGFANGNFADAYWDTKTSGKKHGVGTGNYTGSVVGLTTEQLKKGIPAGFDPKIWAQNPKINNGYPYLIANPHSK